MRNEDQYQWALKKVKRKRGFIFHAILFGFGSLVLFFSNLIIVYPEEPWFIIPVGFWILVLIMHALYAFSGFFTKEWEERQVDKELRKLNGDDVLEDDETLLLGELRRERRTYDDDYV
ncbi:MAG: 2TM domain-containing protein [Bacteroidota bacterium]